MTKLNLILTSLVAAIPGGVMVVLIVMAILSKSENMTGMFHAMNVLLLLASATVMLMPVIIAIWYGRDKPATASTAPADDREPKDDTPEAAAADDDAMAEDADDLDDLGGDDDDLADFADDDDDDWDE